MIGVLNPSYRGGMASFAVFLFVFMGYGLRTSAIATRTTDRAPAHRPCSSLCVLRPFAVAEHTHRAFGGYYSSRIYKAFRGVRWHWNAFMVRFQAHAPALGSGRP